MSRWRLHIHKAFKHYTDMLYNTLVCCTICQALSPSIHHILFQHCPHAPDVANVFSSYRYKLNEPVQMFNIQNNHSINCSLFWFQNFHRSCPGGICTHLPTERDDIPGSSGRGDDHTHPGARHPGSHRRRAPDAGGLHAGPRRGYGRGRQPAVSGKREREREKVRERER